MYKEGPQNTILNRKCFILIERKRKSRKRRGRVPEGVAMIESREEGIVSEWIL